MSEKEVNDSQKTVVAFIAGLLVGGLLVWVFSDTPAQAPSEMTEDVESGETLDVELEPTTNDDGDGGGSSDEAAAPDTPELVVGDAAVTLGDNTTGNLIALESATFPTDEGWIAVRTYRDGQLGNILGASQYSRSAGLTPEFIRLLAPTVAGREYAIVFFSQDSNPDFNLDGDAQLDTELSTFTAN